MAAGQPICLVGCISANKPNSVSVERSLGFRGTRRPLLSTQGSPITVWRKIKCNRWIGILSRDFRRVWNVVTTASLKIWAGGRFYHPEYELLDHVWRSSEIHTSEANITYPVLFKEIRALT